MFPHMYKVRHRKSDDRSSSEDKQDWQGDSWRRNSNSKWPPSSPESPSTTQPPLLNQSNNMPQQIPPQEIPEDLNKISGSPVPWRLNQRSRSNSPAVQQSKATASRPSTPRQRILQEETGLIVPANGSGPRSRSSSPNEVWGTPQEKWGSQEIGTPSSLSGSPRVRRRRDQTPTSSSSVHDASSNGDRENTTMKPDQENSSETTIASPEVANQWADLLGEALMDHKTLDDDVDESLENQKNVFFPSDTDHDLFRGSAASYIPSSKEDFLKKQQKEDEIYILDALDAERDVILEPIMSELIAEQNQKKEEQKKEKDDSNNHLTVAKTESEKEDEDRAWSPGPPIFKNDIQALKQEDIGDRWWVMDKDSQNDDGSSSIPAAPPIPGPPPMPFKTNKVDPFSAMPKIRKRNVDNIKKAVRTRPDWHALMKSLEGGIKLRKIEMNDRSTPILPGSRGKNGKFVYESEKPIIVNELLHEIHRGVRLRKARTDDRSSVDFNKLGLKKFRRQLTVEEKKKVKPEDPDALPSSSDDDEDIDHMRDDLDAVRTQLTDEINKTKKLGREKKVMMIDIEGLQGEVKRLKRQLKEAGIQDKPMEDGIMPKLEKSMSRLRMTEKEDIDFDDLDTIESEVKELTGQIDVQRKRAEGVENKVYELEQKLRVSDGSSDEWEGRAIFFEKKYKALQKDQGIELPDISMASCQTDPIEIIEEETHIDAPKMIDSFGSAARKSGSRRSFASQINRMKSFQEMEEESSSSSSSSEFEEEYEEDEEEEDETIMEDSDAEPDEATLQRKQENEAKRLERDRIYWGNKLDHMLERESNVRKERANLRERIKKFYRDMYSERIEYLKAKTELDEMLKSLKSPEELAEEEDDDEEDDEEHDHSEDEPGWWFDKGPLQPKKLKKRRKKQVEGEGEESEEEEDLEDMTQLEEPEWSDSEGEASDPDDEKDALQVRVNFLQSRSKKHEQKMGEMKKDNYLLKTEVEKCKEKCNEEKLRRRRLDEELNMLLSDMQ